MPETSSFEPSAQEDSARGTIFVRNLGDLVRKTVAWVSSRCGLSVPMVRQSRSKLRLCGLRQMISQLVYCRIEIVSNPPAGRKQNKGFHCQHRCLQERSSRPSFRPTSTEIGKLLDVLILNAGYYNGIQPLGTETVDEWQTVFNTNVLGPYLVYMAFIAKAASDSTIVNISSGIVHLHPFAGFSSYAATLLAGTKVMQYMQEEHPGIRVVDLHPGQVRETGMAAKETGDRYEGVSVMQLRLRSHQLR
ncbi:hypothetical protein ACEPPN_006300 [Leptodophora sp. 'Broadleaf-Isolate-01']